MCQYGSGIYTSRTPFGSVLRGMAVGAASALIRDLDMPDTVSPIELRGAWQRLGLVGAGMEGEALEVAGSGRLVAEVAVKAL